MVSKASRHLPDQFACVLLFIILPASWEPSYGEELPDQVVHALQDNAAAVNHLTVSWKEVRSSRLGLDGLLEFIERPDSKAFFHPIYREVVYQEGTLCYNTRYTQWIAGEFIEVNSDCTFDGELLYVGDNTDIIPSVAIHDREFLATHYPETFVYYADYIEAAGFKAYNQYRTIHRQVESDLLHLIGEGAQAKTRPDSVTNGVPCLMVETTMPDRHDVFWLDPAMQYAVRRHEKYNEQQALLQVTENDRFVELPSPRVWMPQASRVDDYTWPTVPDRIEAEPIMSNDLVVNELSQKTWTPDRFVIDYTRPGTFVLDSRQEAAEKPGSALRDGMYAYRVEVTPEDLALAVAAAKSRRRLVVTQLGALAVIVAVILLAARYRRKRKVGTK